MSPVYPSLLCLTLELQHVIGARLRVGKIAYLQGDIRYCDTDIVIVTYSAPFSSDLNTQAFSNFFHSWRSGIA